MVQLLRVAAVARSHAWGDGCGEIAGKPKQGLGGLGRACSSEQWFDADWYDITRLGELVAACKVIDGAGVLLGRSKTKEKGG